MESGSSSTGGSDSPRGLNFGKKVFYGNLGGGGGGGSSSVPPSAVAERKGKSATQATAAAPRCQVEGCGVDLTGSKAYYCRHKVCGTHSKSPVVVVAGMEQRFCQQCSRFHQLHEFDQGKRSCRRRLAGHNERRRKPVLGTIGRRLPSPCRPPFQGSGGGGRFVGGFLMDFSHPRIPATEGELWPRVRVDGLPAAPWPGSAAGYLGGTATTFGHSCLQALSEGTLFSHSVEELGVSDPGCALSLLSTQPWGSASGAAMRNPSPVEGSASEPWGLKGHDGGASAISGDGQFSGEPSLDSGTGRVSGFSGVHLPWLP